MVGAAVALAFVVPATVLLLASLGAHVGHQAALGVPAGQSHDGAPHRLAGVRLVAMAPGEAADDTTASPSKLSMVAASGALALRRGCAWGEPGRDPYRGSTEQALVAAGLPAEVVRSIAAQRAAGRSADRLRITRDSIRTEAGSRFFDPRRIDLSFGMTMCRGSRVNFVPGHVEMADLYEATDARGRRHAVMVPDVCGNVSVLQAAGEQGVVASVAGSLQDRAVALSSLAEELIYPQTDALLGAEPGLPSPGGVRSSVATSLPDSGGGAVTGRPPYSGPGWPTLLTAGYLTTVSKTLTGGSTVLRTLSGTNNPPPEGGGGSDNPPPVVPPASVPQPPVPQPPASGPTVPEPPASGPPAPPPIPQPPASQPPVPQPPVPQPPASQPQPPEPPRVPRPSIVVPPPIQVPEPGSLAMALLALGLAGLVTRWRRRQAPR